MADTNRYTDVVLARNADGGAVTNVPWSVVHHSPTGFSWGYLGSGPADLALNILNQAVPPGSDGATPVKCYRKTASATAWRLHQQFKEELLASLPLEGGTIKAADIRAFVERHLDPAPSESLAP